MRKLVFALLALLVCAPAFAQVEYFAHVGDTVNTGANTSRIWCSAVAPVPGRGSISVATNGAVTATDSDAFTGMTVDAIHASNVYRRTGIYYYAQGSPIRNFATVTVKTSSTAITITDGNRTPLTAVATSSWGYWVTACQRLLTATGVNYDPNVWGSISPLYPQLSKTRGLRSMAATAYNLFHTPDTLTTSTLYYFWQTPPGWTVQIGTSVAPGLTATTSKSGYPTPNLFGGTAPMNDAPVAISIAVQTSTTDQDRWIIGVQPY